MRIKSDKLEALILAAGKGRRLGDLTKLSHKTLTKINGISLIERQIKILKKNNINKIYVVTGYNAKILRDNISPLNVNFLHNSNYLKTDTLGSFWSAMQCMDDELITLYGDVIFQEEIITNLLNSNEHDITLVVDKSECEKDDMGIFFEDNLIKKIDKKLPKIVANGKYVGIAKFTKTGCKIFKQTLKNFSKNNSLGGDISRVFEEIIGKQHQIHANFTDGLIWLNVNTNDEIKKAKIFFHD